MEKFSRQYTLLRTFGRFFALMYKSLDAWRVTLLYSAIITIFSSGFLITGFCNKDSVQCYIYVSISVFLFLAFIGFCYLIDFYQCAFKNNVFKAGEVFIFNKTKIKSLAVLIGYTLCFILSGVISWFIIAKPANPDWRIESIFFCMFFIFCLVPVFAMRFFAIPAFYLYERKIPALKSLYNITSGRSYIGIVGFLLVGLILSVLDLYLFGYGKRFFMILPSSVTLSVLNRFYNTMVILFTISFLFCFAEAQRQLMSLEMKDSADNEQQNMDIKMAVSVAKSKKKAKLKKK